MKKNNLITSDFLYYCRGSLTGWRKDIRLSEDGKIIDPQIEVIHTAFAEQIGQNLSLYEDEFQEEFVEFDSSVEKVSQLTTKLENLEKEYDSRIERYQCMLDKDFQTPHEQIRAKISYDNILKITEEDMGLSGLRTELIEESNAVDQHRVKLEEGFKQVQVKNMILLNKYNSLILNYLRGIKATAPSSMIDYDQTGALLTKEELCAFEKSYMELHRSVFN